MADGRDRATDGWKEKKKMEPPWNLADNFRKHGVLRTRYLFSTCGITACASGASAALPPGASYLVLVQSYHLLSATYGVLLAYYSITISHPYKWQQLFPSPKAWLRSAPSI